MLFVIFFENLKSLGVLLKNFFPAKTKLNLQLIPEKKEDKLE